MARLVRASEDTYFGSVMGQMPSLACSLARTALRSAGHDGSDIEPISVTLKALQVKSVG